MIATLLLASAFAASSVDELEAVIDDGGVRPALALACSPLSSVIDLAASVPLPPGFTDELMAQDGAAYWLDLLQSGTAAQAGFDLDGALSFTSFNAGATSVVHVPFSGDDAKVVAMLEQATTSRVVGGDGEWTVTNAGGKENRVVRVPGGLRVTAGTPVGLGGNTGLGPILADLPDAQGCAWYVEAPRGLEGSISGWKAVTVLRLPLGGGMFTRLKADKPPPTSLQSSLGAPAGGSSMASPNGVLVVAAPVIDLVKQLPGDEKLPDAELDRLEAALRLDRGITLAVFGEPKALDLAAAVPVFNRRGGPRKARRTIRQLARTLEKDDLAVDRVSPTAFRVLVGQLVISVAARDGLLSFGTNAAAVAETVEGVGTPWVDPRLGALAEEWPLAFTIQLPGTDAGVRAGFRAHADMWEMDVTLRPAGGDPDGTGHTEILEGLLKSAEPNLRELQQRAKRAEVPRQLQSIGAALAARRSAGTSPAPLPATPRDPRSIDAEKSHWTPDGAWAALGLPEAELRGSYWVEIDEQGAFTVHGVIDGDGDGVPAHYRLHEGGEPEQLTDPSVF